MDSDQLKAGALARDGRSMQLGYPLLVLNVRRGGISPATTSHEAGAK